MPHHRTTIRTALITAFGSLTFPVYSERRDRLDAVTRPCAILTMTADEEDTTRRTTGWTVEHVQTVLIELHVNASTGVEAAEAIDAMELEIEGAIAGSDGGTLGGIVELVEPGGSDIEFSREQDSIVAVRSLTYVASWRARFGQPDNPETS